MSVMKASNLVKPGKIRRCRTNYVKAIGTATAQHRLRGMARRQARAEAKRQREFAVRAVRRLRCPVRGGCKKGCRPGRTLPRGFGVETSRPRRVKKDWIVTAVSYASYDVVCTCPR